MHAELLNPFISSFNQAVSMFFSDNPQKKKVQALNALNSNTNVHVFLGIAGDLYGTVLFSATKEDALQLASAMAGMPFDDFDDISASALQELLNITSGGAATEFSQMGIFTEITPPTFVTGDRIDVRLSFPMISVQLVIDTIQVYLNLSVKKRKTNKVLIVESNVIMRKRAAATITLNGFEVIGDLSKSSECLEYLQSNKPDIILFDISKSCAEDLQTLERIKQNYPEIKVVVTTALEQSVQKNINLNADDYITKPYEDKALLTKLKNL